MTKWSSINAIVRIIMWGFVLLVFRRLQGFEFAVIVGLVAIVTGILGLRDMIEPDSTPKDHP